MNFLMYMGAIIIFVFVLKILTFPIRLIGRLVANSIIGGILLYFLAKIGIFIVITWWSILLTAILGVLGVVIAVILTILF